jgi:hypothetical protein
VFLHTLNRFNRVHDSELEPWTHSALPPLSDVGSAGRLVREMQKNVFSMTGDIQVVESTFLIEIFTLAFLNALELSEGLHR